MIKNIFWFILLNCFIFIMPVYAATGEDENWNWYEFEVQYNENNTVDGFEDNYKVSEVDRDEIEINNCTTISVGIGQSYIYRNGVIVQMDAPAFTNSTSYTMVPLRAIAECLDGAEVVKTAAKSRQRGMML